MFLFRLNKNNYYLSSNTKLFMLLIIILIQLISNSNSNILYNKINILSSLNDNNDLKKLINSNNNNNNDQKLVHVSYPFDKTRLDRNENNYITAPSDIYTTTFDLSNYDDLKDIPVSDLNTIFQEMEKNELQKTSWSSPISSQFTTPSSSYLGFSKTGSGGIGSGKTSKQNGSSSSHSSGMSMSPQTRRLIGEMSIYFSIAICLMGIITNFLSLKVFCSTKVPRTSSRTYLIALSVTDLIFLVVHFIGKMNYFRIFLLKIIF